MPSSATSPLADQFIDLACLCYDDPHYDHRSFHAQAKELLAEHPEVAKANIWAAATAGDLEAARIFLDHDPGCVNRPGPHGWAPLLCACYSRIQSWDGSSSTYQVASLLLDRGADPNAFTMRDNDPPGTLEARRFTALTGVFGGGSTGLANQPPHPRWRELAELLLTSGADPADEQALWINQEASLEMLLRFGLKPDAQIRRRAATMTLLGRELSRAASKGHESFVKLLLSHGARTGETLEGKTAWRYAMENGNFRIAQLLEQAGSPTSPLNNLESFVALILTGDEPGARAMLREDPTLIAQSPPSMVLMASGTGRIEAVRLALDLGFHPDVLDEVTALHNAAGRGDVAIVRLLLERGASRTIREPFYDATAASWADFFDQTGTRDLLLM